jgi:hypothetical protein
MKSGAVTPVSVPLRAATEYIAPLPQAWIIPPDARGASLDFDQ